LTVCYFLFQAENLSVQGDEKFEKVVAFNKHLRQFKRIHDRNKVLCQESLQELSIEAEEAGTDPSALSPSTWGQEGEGEETADRRRRGIVMG
jgi:hypothetical protein